MEEIKMVEDCVVEVMDDVIEDCAISVNPNFKTVGLVAAAAVGITAWFRKNRDKLTERQIAKLEKKGYIVSKSVPLDGVVEYDLVDETK